jgi:hypothetical protein
MKHSVAALMLIATPVFAVAPLMKPLPLAKETADLIKSMESMLEGSIRSGDKNDFYRFVEKPVMDQMQKWPQVGTAGYDDYARCYFALDSFRVYAQDQFKARGALQQARAALAAAKLDLERHEGEVVRQFGRVKGLEHLLDKRERAISQQRELRDQRQLDELSSLRHRQLKEGN